MKSSDLYQRKNYKKDVIYTFFQYKEFHASFGLRTGTMHVSDKLAEQMLTYGEISDPTMEEYLRKIKLLFTPLDSMDELIPEQIYLLIQQIRRKKLGINALETERIRQWSQEPSISFENGIDQRDKKIALLKQADHVFILLTQAEWSRQMKEDLTFLQQTDKKIHLLVSPTTGWDIPDRAFFMQQLDRMSDWDTCEIPEATPETLQILLENFLENTWSKKPVLLAYGEDCFFLCRNLPLDAMVHGTPTGYFTRALTNQFHVNASCIVYVPTLLDIVDWVPLIERTRLSFRHLYVLWKKYGDSIYQFSPLDLYRQYPQHFLNIYATDTTCKEAEPDYPISLKNTIDLQNLSSYDNLRDKAISEYLNQQNHLQYYSSYFDEHLEEQEIPWTTAGSQKGILVQGIRLSRVKDADIINCEEGMSVRQILGGESLKLISNFLFFMTPPLVRLYNELRKNRPQEQIDFDKMHLDYMLCHKNGQRTETFPLFEKACIAKKQDGQFLFFNYRLGGGKILLGDIQFCWQATDINVPGGKIFTPDYSRCDENENEHTYRKIVGDSRLNLVIIQNRVHSIRKGDVVLPSIGVVVSLDHETETCLLSNYPLKPLGNGYYDPQGLPLSILLNGPSQIPAKEWQQVEWAYGGGMSLILDGVGLDNMIPPMTDGDIPIDLEQQAAITWFRKEGWMTPLSRQTQESALHKLTKHPRTAIGITEKNELVILVFSGRIRLSSGANYYEMCRIAHKLIPDIRHLMNVDGGGSAMLGMVQDDCFMELSCPATSGGSCTGMVRPINTVLCLEL